MFWQNWEFYEALEFDVISAAEQDALSFGSFKVFDDMFGMCNMAFCGT